MALIRVSRKLQCSIRIFLKIAWGGTGLELEKLTAAEIGRFIEAGKLDPLAVAEAFVGAIKAHPQTR